MMRKSQPCPFHGTACEYVPLAHEAAALKVEMQRIADLTEKWTDSLVSQVNEIARAALGGKDHE